MLPRAMESLGLRKSGAVVHVRRPRSMRIVRFAKAKGYARRAKSEYLSSPRRWAIASSY